MDRVQSMLTKAYVSIRAVQRDGAARALYVKHFNNASLTNLPAATNVVRLMHDRIASQAVLMTYVPDLIAFNALGFALPPGVAFANVGAFVVQNGIAPGTTLTIYVGPSFFGGLVYLPKAPGEASGTGVLLHELSHGVGGTQDHAYTHSGNYRSLSVAQRVTNADSYRAYAQEFDRL
jgi:hypothetical protein